MSPGRNDTTIQIPVNSLFLDLPITCLKCVWSSVVEVITSIVLVWIEPIMDSKSLIDLSIGMLLMQRVGANIQRYEPKKAMTERVHSRDSGSGESGDSVLSSGVLYGSPFVALLGGLALISCLANVRPDVRRLAPIWIRVFLPRNRQGGGPSSVSLMYLLLILFAVESLLMVSIVMFGCHAIIFPELLEEDLQILTYLICAWLAGLLASNVVRYHLYYSISD